MARRRKRNPTARTAALIGAGIGIGVGLLAAHAKVPKLGTAWGVVTAAAGGLLLGAAAGGARTGADFRKALLEPAR